MSQVIDVVVVVDTVSVLAAYPNPSQTSTSPTPIAHNNSFMVAPASVV